MSTVTGVNYNNSILGQSILNIKTQMTQLQAELASGEKSTTYAGMGANEGFAIAARAQVSNISAFTNTITNVNTTIDAANAGLQSIGQIGQEIGNEVTVAGQTLNGNGQTSAQASAAAQLTSLVGILNTPSGNNYLFSGSATNTPAVVSADQILNGTSTQAGLKQVIAERNQADGTSGLGRLVIASPTTTSVTLSEATPNSVFGMKLGSVTSKLTGATVTGPTGSPASISVALGATNPNSGDTITFNFNLPDGTTTSTTLTATTANPPPTGSFTIGTTPAATAANLSAALTTAVGTQANTSLVAASAMTASSEFFNWSTTATGSAVKNQASPATPITGATALSGTAPSDSLTTGFQAGDTITVNGTPITFVASGATGNQLNVTDSVQTLLSKIDSITGTSTPSTISAGVITLNDGSALNLTVTSSRPAALAALGFSSSVNATPAPLRVAPNPYTDATFTGTAVNDNSTSPVPISASTLLSGASGALTSGFTAGQTITVDGNTLTFVASGASGPNQINVTDTVGTLLSKIDALSGATTASSVGASGAITLHTGTTSDLMITSSNGAALAALGIGAAVGQARGGGPTSLVAGTPANTVSWYTGANSTTPRASLTARVDQSQTVQYGIQANEQAITTIIQNVALLAAVTTSTTSANAGAQVAALGERVATNLSSPPGQQSISDIESDLASAQTTMKDVGARQSQAQAALQNVISTTETVSPDQVASELLSLQTSLQASYQTTSMLSQLNLVKFLPVGG